MTMASLGVSACRLRSPNQISLGRARPGRASSGQVRSGRTNLPRPASVAQGKILPRPQPQPPPRSTASPSPTGQSHPMGQGPRPGKELTRLCFAIAGVQAWHVLSRDWGGCVSQPQAHSVLQLAPCSVWAWPVGRLKAGRPRLSCINQPALTWARDIGAPCDI